MNAVVSRTRHTIFRTTTSFLTVVLLLTSPALGGKFNRKLSLGDAAPVFKNLEGVDGSKYSLDDFKGKDVVVVVVTCNSCPVAQRYEDRIVAFNKKYAGRDSKVALVAISVSKDEDDTLPKMKERATAKGFMFPYVHDASQDVGRALGASRTPEFFVMNKERKIVYLGALDNEDNGEAATVNYLEAAVNSALKGEKPAIAESAPRGCGITYEKKK